MATDQDRCSRRDVLARGLAATAALAHPLARRLRAAEPDRPAGSTLQIDGDFPGGNAVVERIEGDDVYLHQDLHDTNGWWFYWCFRVRGAAGRTLRFHFTNKNVLAARGPAVSTDGGKTWNWLGRKTVKGASFAYSFPEESGPKKSGNVRFCLGMPYQEADLRKFLKRYAGNPHLRVETHSTTKKGRTTERLRLGKLDGEPQYRALLTCRHHACEMMASWTLEGIMESVLADTDDGRWFRRNVEFLVVPFMDKDGVEDGDQGKNRKPFDHNRDYEGQSIYPSVAALREFVPKWSAGRLKFALDMHCPWIRGGGDKPGSNEQVYLVGNPSPGIWRRQQEFGKILQQVQTGPLVYSAKHNLPWGQAWNKGKCASCGNWTSRLPGISLGTSMEIPYATAGGRPVTVESTRALGRDLTRAIRRYLEKHGR